MELWYKNAIIYSVDVARFADSNGDGWGDLPGLIDRLDYLHDLGVTCLWLLPIHPTPYRDNGYDVANYYGVDPRFGSLDDFIRLVHAAGERGMRILIDLVMNHTSDQHPWFQAARRDRTCRYHRYYHWTTQPPPPDADVPPVFPDVEKSVWTFDEVAGEYFYHRFYHFQPDVNVSNPEVREEIDRVMEFWLALGVSGFRVDAAPMLAGLEDLPMLRPRDPHGIFKAMRRRVEERRPTAVLLGESNVEPERLAPYFGEGDEFNMLFGFLLAGHIFLAIVREQPDPLVRILKQLPATPDTAQWVNFLRNHDELNLSRIPQPDREEIFAALGPRPEHQIFGRGLRRRLAPMLGGDRRRIELAFSLMFSLPGTPMLFYGDEIGMGDDLAQEGRNAVRVPMQWTARRNAGFSTAPPRKLIQPVIADGPFGYKHVNAQAQERDPDSLLHWLRRIIRTRRECHEFGRDVWHMLDAGDPAVMAHRCAWQGGIVVAMHNLSSRPRRVELDLSDQRGRVLRALLGAQGQVRIGEQPVSMELEGYGFRWYRIEGERPAD